MREFTSDDVVARRFSTGRRRGYDTMEVDEYLEHLAEYIGRVRGELARHEATERAALDVLHHAQRVADETLATATRDADEVGRRAKAGIEGARTAARRMLDDARVEADRILASAQERAESMLDEGRSRLAGLEVAAAARTAELDAVADEVNRRVTETVASLRTQGNQLVERANRLELEAATRFDRLDLRDLEVIDLRDDSIDIV